MSAVSPSRTARNALKKFPGESRGSRHPREYSVGGNGPLDENENESEVESESYQGSEPGEGPPHNDPWTPCLQKFSVVVAFNPTSDASHEDYTLNHESLKATWANDKLQHHLCKLKFDSCIVHKITLSNKSTGSSFNGQLKILDAKDEKLYTSIATYGCDTAVETDNTQQHSGTPLWGEESSRIIYSDPKRPTKADIAFSGFDVDSLREGVSMVKYELPADGNRRRHTKGNKVQSIQHSVAHIPKIHARYFCHALKGAYRNKDFINSPAHSVAGMPHMFCLNSEDYEKVLEAYNNKKGTVRSHDITTIKIRLATASNGVLPKGPHFFQLTFEVWMASQDCVPEDQDSDNESEYSENSDDE